MNVFDEQRGRIALYAPKGSRHSATIVILLEKLKYVNPRCAQTSLLN
jgi:hypothetical protein